MERSSKRRRQIITRFEDLPSCVLVFGILQKLDLETLCTVACVSTTLRSSVSEALAFIPSFHLPDFYPDSETIDKLLPKCTGIKTLTLDCLRLNGDSVIKGLGSQIEELILLRIYTFYPIILQQIAEKCPNLRALVLETRNYLDIYQGWISHMLSKCNKLESFCLKIQPKLIERLARPYPSIGYINHMPKTIKSLTLEPVSEHEAFVLASGVSYFSSLQKLSLVLEVISDRIVRTLARNAPHLLELDLRDDPLHRVGPYIDLSNLGLQAIGIYCRNLKTLVLARNHNHFLAASFQYVDESGIILLSRGCRELESLTLNGFSHVPDEGFGPMLRSLPKLKKFEARNVDLLTDESFRDLNKAPCSFTEVKFFTTMLTETWENFTSSVLKPNASNSRLERLNFHVTAPKMEYISFLNRLTSLDFYNTDVTDEGLLALSKGYAPIKRLSLRTCVKVTDHGIFFLFCNGGIISKTLTTLDLSMICGVTDVAIETIANSAFAVTELCVKCCHAVTDSSINALARKGLFDAGRNKPLRKLDIAHCSISNEYLKLLLGGTFYKGLRWLGVEGTPYYDQNDDESDEEEAFSALFLQVVEERPWLTMCTRGCDMGCNDNWNCYNHHADFVLSNQAPPCHVV